MNLRVNKKDLVDGISIVQKAVSSKSPMPILECICLEAKDQRLILRGSDVELSIETSFTTEIAEEGAIAINSRMLGDIIRKLPNGVITLETAENNTVIISAEKSVLNLLYMDASEFPVFPTVEDAVTLSLQQKDLRIMVRRVLFSVAQDDSRPVLNGMLLEGENGNLNMVGLDGYRMALATTSIPEVPEVRRVISGKALRDVLSILTDNDEEVRLVFAENHVLFEMGATKIISRLLQGEFLKYRNMIPDYHKLSVILDRQEFFEATERASVLANDGTSNLIKMQFTDNSVVLSSHSKLGKLREEVYAEMDGEAMELAFNAKYILDILKTIEDEKIVMDLTSALSPCLIHPEGSTDSMYLVLPVRISR
ncbi:DNA polymerase III beta subunit [Clostridiaceae bacterium JG1575]|nr:DNA polymerase III beta subunit [Clostridiaceae bacterium JG1575]